MAAVSECAPHRPGFTPGPVPRAILDVTWGGARSRVQPCAMGGAGALWSRGVDATIFVRGALAELVEREWRDTGLAVNRGAGVRVMLHRLVSLRPELRIYSASALSRRNLSLLRFSLVLGFHF